MCVCVSGVWRVWGSGKWCVVCLCVCVSVSKWCGV